MRMSAAHATCVVPHDDLPDLSQVSLFAGLGAQTTRRLAQDMHIISVSAGRIVVEQGELSQDVYVVLSGRLIGLMLSSTGRELAFTEIGPGNYFGEIAALDGQPRSITISAAVPSRLARLSGEALRRWLREEPGIAANIARDLASRNRVLTDHIFGLVVHDVDKRVRILLSRLAQERKQLVPGGMLSPAPTHEAMATRIGANREAVSRVISRLNREGIIEAGRKKIVLRNIDSLLHHL
jgi:CRP-like cAMP-binding protein